jgi:hypothetical protein
VAAKEAGWGTVPALVLAGIFDNYTGFLSGLNNSKKQRSRSNRFNGDQAELTSLVHRYCKIGIFGLN